MANPFETIVQMIQPSVNLLVGDLVDVVFPDGTRVNQITAIASNEQSEADANSGLIIEVQLRQFAIAAEDLPQSPVRNMEITWRGNVYRARHPGGSKVWEWQDHHETRYLINCELVGPTSAPAGPYRSANGGPYENRAGLSYGKPD